jgi:hypothetical protein
MSSVACAVLKYSCACVPVLRVSRFRKLFDLIASIFAGTRAVRSVSASGAKSRFKFRMNENLVSCVGRIRSAR